MSLHDFLPAHRSQPLLILFVASALAAPTPWSKAESEAEELFDPVGIFLTWQQDPTTTMTIDWHTLPGKEGVHRVRPPSLLYQKVGDDEEWKKAPGTMHAFPYTSRTVNRVELTGLEPDTTYRFRFGPAPTERMDFAPSTTYKFRTMPASLEDRPVRVGVGGDTGSGDGFRRVNEAAMEHDLDFVVIGGDLAYADGGARDWYHDVDGRTKQRWSSWFDVYKQSLITEEGRVVPMLPAIGNHEVWSGYYTAHPDYEQTDVWRERLAPIYYNIFAFPGQPGYATLDFGDYLSFILLDSNHSNPIVGQQTEWLDEVLAERHGVPHVFPVYHVAAYPTVRGFHRERKVAIREHWHPLFEQHGVKIAFENHDHTYKRTYPIRAGEIDPDGVVYIGDGAWGKGGRADRMHDPDETWYLKRALPDLHFILVTLDPSGRELIMINDEGEVIDRYPDPDEAP